MSKLPFEGITRKILTRVEFETNPNYGKDPSLRTAEELLNYGIINVDKPKGPTSHQVAAYVKDILHVSKAGHSGTLDPGVTGVLAIAVDKATRIVQALLPAGKEYIAIMHLHKLVDENVLRDVIEKKFLGKIRQLPPVKSAVVRQERSRNIYYIEIMEIDGQDVLMKVGCQAGTYIRKLLHDLGLALGTGAHMAELRRTKAGPFDESTIVSLTDLQDAYHYYKKEGNDKLLRKCIQPFENAAKHLPKVWILDTTVDSLCHGANLGVPGLSKAESDIKPEDTVAVMTLKHELVALGTAKMNSDDMVKKERGFAVIIDKVFMDPGVYPRREKKIEENPSQPL